MSQGRLDCTYTYFKPSGKWYTTGRGRFPRTDEVNRDTIIAECGEMPGLHERTRAGEFVVVVVPDDDCDAPLAYPRVLKPETE